MKVDWEKNGFLVLPGFLSSDMVADANKYIDDVMTLKTPESERLVADIFVGTPSERRIFLKDAPGDIRTRPYKLNDLFLESELIRNIVLNDRLSQILGELIGGSVLLCNTLNFEFGSQQDFHTDSLYMTPPKDLNLVATWTALEDCSPDAGPLRYYPGSHRIRPYKFSTGRITAVDSEMVNYKNYMLEQVQKLGLTEQRFCARKGDVFIWHSQLFHGGSPINTPGLTRRSLVAHYFRAADLPGNHACMGRFKYYQQRDHQPVPS